MDFDAWRALMFGPAVVICAAAPHYHMSRPRTSCSLPDRDYQFHSFCQPEIRLGDRVPLVRLPTAMRSPAAIDVYQFKVASMRRDHCSLSNVSVQLHKDGRWVLSLRADQNPLQVPALEVAPNVTTKEDLSKYTAHLRRNLFVVRLRCYAAYDEQDGPTLLGKPVVVSLNAHPFWVERAQPYHLFTGGVDPAVAEFFDTIKKVEIEFTYRHAPHQQYIVP